MTVRSLYVSILVILVCTGIMTAQNEKIFHFGVNVAPKITSQRFNEPHLAFGQKKFGMSAGVDAYYDLSSRMEFKSGLNFSFVQIQQVDSSLVFGADFNGHGFDTLNSWTRDQLKIYYLGIPVELKMKIYGNENHIYAKLGAETLFKVASQSNSYLVESLLPERMITGNEINQLRTVLFRASAGVGFEFRIANKHKMYLEPQIEYSVNGIFKNRGLRQPLNNSRILDIGLVVGFRF